MKAYGKGLSRRPDPPLSRARPHRSRQLGMVGQNEHHDHGLAHGDGILAVPHRVLHLGAESQLRDGTEKPGVRDQHPDRRSRAEGCGHRQQLRRDVDKFEKFELSAVPGTRVGAPIIGECYANLECKLVDSNLIGKYGLFVLEVVKAHAAMSPRYPRTIHYRGDGVFMISGANSAKYRNRFKSQNL
jgi:hypothetical protein